MRPFGRRSILILRLGTGSKARLQEAAARCGIKLSDFIRRTALAEAKWVLSQKPRKKEDPWDFRIRLCGRWGGEPRWNGNLEEEAERRFQEAQEIEEV